MPTPNPTYRQAAEFAFKRVMDLIGDYSVFNTTNGEPSPNGYWHMANTLDTCLQHRLIAQTEDHLDTFGLVENALDKVFDARMQAKGEPVQPADWGKWSRTEGGPWADDYGWWGMALTRAYRNRVRLGYDSLFSDRILKYARNSFTALAYGWDPKEAVTGSGVYGGAWNHEDVDQAMTGRNSVTNEVLWIFSQLMNEIDNTNPAYGKQIAASQKFFFDAYAKKWSDQGALLNEVGLVRERLLGMIHEHPSWYWAGDQGLFMGACVGRESNSPNAPLALTLAEQVTANMLDSGDSKEAVLHDSISPDSNFNDDYATGKGVFMRNWTLWIIRPSTSRPSNFADLIVANATALWNNRVTPDASGNAQYQFGFNWNPAAKGGEPKYPNGDMNPSNFSLLVCQVAGLAALSATCFLPEYADQQIPAK